MAARKFSRAATGPVRPDSNPLQIPPRQSLPESAKQHLQSLLTALRDIEGTVIVSAHALREEEELVGMCVSRILRTQVSDRLSLEIDRATTLFSIELPTHRALEE